MLVIQLFFNRFAPLATEKKESSVLYICLMVWLMLKICIFHECEADLNTVFKTSEVILYPLVEI